MSPRDIILKWPSAEIFADDLGLKFRSHGRVMRLRNSIPSKYWDDVVAAARRREIVGVTHAALKAAHAKPEPQPAGAAA